MDGRGSGQHHQGHGRDRLGHRHQPEDTVESQLGTGFEVGIADGLGMDHAAPARHGVGDAAHLARGDLALVEAINLIELGGDEAFGLRDLGRQAKDARIVG